MALIHRVARQQAGQGPGPDLSEVGRYNTPAEMPNVLVTITPSIIGYQDLLPIYTADGAPKIGRASCRERV